MNGIHALLLLALTTASCAVSAGNRVGPTIEIPTFAASDPRIGQAGFVAQTLRLNLEENGVRYTLMAFRAGDTWTLGAMVHGDFAGEVRWQIGEKRLSMPFSSAKPAASTAVTVEPLTAEPLVAQGASFRGTAWTNLELGKDWLTDGTPLQLQFVPQDGKTITMPDAGTSYSVLQVAR
jgi:hypothetical protein